MDATAALRYAGGSLLVAAAAAIALILLGTFDPQPAGKLIWQVEPDPVTITPDAPQIVWQPTPALEKPLSVRFEATTGTGGTASYGLALGDEADHLVAAVMPTGYTSVWRVAGPDQETILPWQLWPHVRAERNELWIDVFQGNTRIWINRELLWQGELVLEPRHMGIFGQSSSGEMIVEAKKLALFQNGGD